MPFFVEKTSYGATITDSGTLEQIAVTQEEWPALKAQLLQQFESDVEIDFNTVVYSRGPETDGAITHTFSPKCPQGCYGQFEDCYYKPKTRRLW